MINSKVKSSVLYNRLASAHYCLYSVNYGKSILGITFIETQL